MMYLAAFLIVIGLIGLIFGLGIWGLGIAIQAFFGSPFIDQGKVTPELQARIRVTCANAMKVGPEISVGACFVLFVGILIWVMA